jgi:hypothetical protein
MTLGRGVTCYISGQLIISRDDGSETGIYEIKAAARQQYHEPVLLWSSVTTLYEDDVSWDAHVVVVSAAAQQPDYIKIEIRDPDLGNDDVSAVAGIRMTRIDIDPSP